ncbi:AAA family ATPase [Candidatus Woesebacteria bacterium]|nr:AAA family ATPase [Candidatus Woesebacteria bacterium]
MTTGTDQVTALSDKVKSANLPTDLAESILGRLYQLSRLTNSPTFLPEFDRINKYVEWVLAVPWNKRTDDILDLDHARQTLDKNHYGLTEIKDRILEYISVMRLQKEKGEKGSTISHAPILCFVGLVGTGKTTFAYSIAEALGRKFARIPFGGMGDPLDLRGQSRMHPEAEPGKIVKALRFTQSKNSVILLDEIDRVTDEGRASIMGVLVELLDPEQNQAFVDHYIDYPVDLSEILFITTANNTTHISTAVLDRLEPIMMPSYSDEEKIMIGRAYILPKIVKASGIPGSAIEIAEEVWPHIVRPLGFDAGIRTLERTIDGIVRKVARNIVEGKGRSFKVTPENIKEFLPSY